MLFDLVRFVLGASPLDLDRPTIPKKLTPINLS